VNIVEAEDDRGQLHLYLVAIEPDDLSEHGLVAEAIVGELTGGPDHLDPDHFRPNPLFVQFLHWVLARHAAASPGFLEEAARQKEGHVYILDARTPTPDGAVPPEDIIGAIEISGAKPLRYVGSSRYVAFTHRGGPQLDPWLHARLVDELRALASRP
jgi:hypothetical protein